MLWIKTRVGLCALHNDFEIRVHTYEKTKIHGLFAQIHSSQKAEGRSLFGKIKYDSIWIPLARFTDHPDVKSEIGIAMQTIVDSIASNTICDLSQVGTSEAWHPAWNQIQWTRN